MLDINDKINLKSRTLNKSLAIKSKYSNIVIDEKTASLFVPHNESMRFPNEISANFPNEEHHNNGDYRWIRPTNKIITSFSFNALMSKLKKDFINVVFLHNHKNF